MSLANLLAQNNYDTTMRGLAPRGEVTVRESRNGGTSAMVAGAVTIPCESAGNISSIHVTPRFAPAGRLYVANVVSGVSFDILSTDAGDAGNVSWLCFENDLS
jgi:hypothetical protein